MRVKIGETEIVWDNLNPDFAKSFVIDFVFETVQLLKAEVVDCDDDKDVKNRLIGSTEFELGRLIGSQNNTLILPLIEDKKTNGNIIVRSEKVARDNDILTLDFMVASVPAGGFCCVQPKHFIE